MKPTVGRIVLIPFGDDGKLYPAIVCRVHDDGYRIDAVAFVPHLESYTHTTPVFNIASYWREEDCEPHGWRWPPIKPEGWR